MIPTYCKSQQKSTFICLLDMYLTTINAWHYKFTLLIIKCCVVLVDWWISIAFPSNKKSTQFLWIFILFKWFKVMRYHYSKLDFIGLDFNWTMSTSYYRFEIYSIQNILKNMYVILLRILSHALYLFKGFFWATNLNQ